MMDNLYSFGPGATMPMREDTPMRAVGIKGAARATMARELLTAPADFEYLALDGQFRTLVLAAGELGFTYCQVPVVYRVGRQRGLVVWRGVTKQELGGASALPADLSAAIFGRTGRVTRVDVTVLASNPAKTDKVAQAELRLCIRVRRIGGDIVAAAERRARR